MEQQSRWLWRQIPGQVNCSPANALPDRAISPAANCPAAQQGASSLQPGKQITTAQPQSELNNSWISYTSCVFIGRLVEMHTVDVRMRYNWLCPLEHNYFTFGQAPW